MKKLVIGLVIAGVSLLVVTQFVLGDPGYGSGRGYGYRDYGPEYVCRTDQVPDLTEEQKVKLDEINKSFREKAKGPAEELQQKGSELAALMAKPEGNEETIKAMISEVKALEGEFASIRVYHRAEVDKILTSEQRESLDRFGGRPGYFGRGNSPRQGRSFGMMKQSYTQGFRGSPRRMSPRYGRGYRF